MANLCLQKCFHLPLQQLPTSNPAQSYWLVASDYVEFQNFLLRLLKRQVQRE